MRILKPRTRLVNFRLNEEEYECLRSACTQQGARSLSDFARSVVLREVGHDEWGERWNEKRLSSLGRKVSRLESEVRDLLELVRKSERGEVGAGVDWRGWRGSRDD